MTSPRVATRTPADCRYSPKRLRKGVAILSFPTGRGRAWTSDLASAIEVRGHGNGLGADVRAHLETPRNVAVARFDGATGVGFKSGRWGGGGSSDGLAEAHRYAECTGACWGELAASC